MAKYSTSEILEQLDASAGDFTFPMLDHGYTYLVDARLHAFRDDARWAIVIEVVGYNPRGGNLYDVLHYYGNCLSGDAGFTNDDFLGRVENWDEVEDLEEPEIWRGGATSIAVRDHVIPVDAVAGDRLEAVFRGLVPAQREIFLGTEDEVRARIPNDLPRFLQLEEWNHPDVVVGEKPSDSETFRQLAEALVADDTSRFAPAAPPNTHWSNWPEGGLL
jgi:hypothetical protein